MGRWVIAVIAARWQFRTAGAFGYHFTVGTALLGCRIVTYNTARLQAWTAGAFGYHFIVWTTLFGRLIIAVVTLHRVFEIRIPAYFTARAVLI